MSKKIDKEMIESFSQEFYSDRANVIAANASNNNGLAQAAVDYQGFRSNKNSFSIEIKSGSITNQKASGRCWIFSAMNKLRYELMAKNELEDFELSQNYLYFWDKLEKANYFLESVIKIVDEPVDGRLYSYLNMAPLNDGGQWDMIVNLVNKYGVCPKEAYPDSANAEASGTFVNYLTSKLREDAVELRKMIKSGQSEEEVIARKEEMLAEVYRVLVISLGEPPVAFDWVVKNKKGELIQEFGITPQQFYEKYVGMDVNDYISLINAPTADKPFNKLYTVKFLGNVIEDRPVTYLNLEIDKVKEAAIKQLKDGHPVWFGSDVGKFGQRKAGIWDPKTLDIAQFLNIEYNFTKGDRLTYGDSAMNHAMVLLGVNLNEEGKPDRWKIENSWGKDAGRNGYYVCSDEWFDEFVYQICIDKKYIDEDTLKLLDQQLIELEPWDPMGSLAD